MAERLQIVIDALNLAQDELDQVQSELKGIDKQGTKTSKRGLADVRGGFVAISAAATGVFLAARKAFNFLKEGAQLERTEEKFRRLARGIGTTADTLESELGQAMDGLLSRQEMLAGATELMSLGLVKNQDSAVRLAKVIAELDMNTSQLVRTITNKTIMRFDQLGVQIDGFHAKLSDATGQVIETGVRFQKVSQQDFLTAFLAQAEEQIERVGSVSDTSRGDIMEFEAEWEDMANSVKKGIKNALLPALKNFNDIADSVQGVTDAYDDLEKAVIDGDISLEEYNETIDGARNITTSTGTAFRILTSIFSKNRNVSEEVRQAAVGLTEQQLVQMRVTEGVTVRQRRLETTIKGSEKATRDYGESVKQVGENMGLAAMEAGDLMDEMSRDVESPFRSWIEDQKWILATGGQINETIKMIMDGVEGGELNRQEAMKFSKQAYLDLLDAQEEMGMINMDEAARQYDEVFGGGIEEAKEKLAGTDGLDEALKNNQETFETLTEKGVAPMIDHIDTLQGSLDELIDGVYPVNVILNVVASGQTSMGTGGEWSPGGKPDKDVSPQSPNLDTSTMESQLDRLIGLQQQQLTDTYSYGVLNSR